MRIFDEISQYIFSGFFHGEVTQPKEDHSRPTFQSSKVNELAEITVAGNDNSVLRARQPNYLDVRNSRMLLPNR